MPYLKPLVPEPEYLPEWDYKSYFTPTTGSLGSPECPSQKSVLGLIVRDNMLKYIYDNLNSTSIKSPQALVYLLFEDLVVTKLTGDVHNMLLFHDLYEKVSNTGIPSING